MHQPIWTPSPERVANANLTRFMKFLGSRVRHNLTTYEELYDFSITHYAQFWANLWDFAEIVNSKTFNHIVVGDNMWEQKWFDGSRLNFAENLLRYRDDRPALIGRSEAGHEQRLTYAELYREVARCAAGLKALGVGPNDRVAAFIPNIPEAVIAMLAATSIGAIWSSCSPDFGLNGVLDRFGQIEPKVLIAADGYQYAGKYHDSIEPVRRIVEHLPAIEQVVIISYSDTEQPAELPNCSRWADVLDNDADTIDFAQLPFDHPVYIMYSSGTTGVPKCMVHGAGGTLLQHYKEHVLHTDLRREDVITYYTTCGWMMWNWLASALQVGATVLVYDGSPAQPDAGVLWRMIEQERITIFGTSPKFLSTCENAGIVPRDDADLHSLRTILSTGSPLSEQNFAWVYTGVKKDIQLASISGGTDIVSCFLLGCPILPVHAGEIQCRGLGMKVETFSPEGRPVSGEVGELVCTAPFPSRPIYFWNDPDRSLYRKAYFEHFPGVWRHGDYIRITDTGGVVVYGRSDATLNPGGVRIGTAEIYGPVEALPEIHDSIVVGQEWDNDVRIVLFVVLANGADFTEELQERLRRAIREARTPRHVPAKIIRVDEIPHTINGKKVELAVTNMIHGREVANRDALANPNCLNQFRDIPELQR